MTDNDSEGERDIVLEVEELLAKATPGPWRLQPKDYIIGDEHEDEAVIVGHIELGDTPEERAAGEHNLNLIIRARNDLLRRMVEEVKRLRKQQKAHAEMVDGYHGSR